MTPSTRLNPLHVVGAFCLTVACVLYLVRIPTPIGSLSLFRLCCLGYLMAAVIALARRPRLASNRYFLRVALATLLLVLPTLIDVLVFRPPPEIVNTIYGFWINLVFPVCFVLLVDARSVDVYIKTYLYFSLFELGLSVFVLATGYFPFESSLRDLTPGVAEQGFLNLSAGVIRLTGTFFDPNFYGMYLVSVIAIGWWMYERKGRSTLLAVIVLAALIQLVLTASRTAMLGLVGVMLANVLYRPIKLKALAVYFAILAALPVIFLLVGTELQERISSLESVSDRFVFYSGAINAFVRSPLLGEGSVALIEPTSGFSSAHMVYLSVLGRNGLIGLGMLAVAILLLAFPVYRRSHVSIEYRSLGMSLLLMSMFVFLGYDVLYFFEPLYLWLGLVVVCFAVKRDPAASAPQLQNGSGLGGRAASRDRLASTDESSTCAG